MKKKLQKPYLTDKNLLITQDLWQTHYPILLINIIQNTSACASIKIIKKD